MNSSLTLRPMARGCANRRCANRRVGARRLGTVVRQRISGVPCRAGALALQYRAGSCRFWSETSRPVWTAGAAREAVRLVAIPEKFRNRIAQKSMGFGTTLKLHIVQSTICHDIFEPLYRSERINLRLPRRHARTHLQAVQDRHAVGLCQYKVMDARF